MIRQVPRACVFAPAYATLFIGVGHSELLVGFEPVVMKIETVLDQK